jgi:hypothetical protein
VRVWRSGCVVMPEIQRATQQIRQILEQYGQGLHQGDATLLRPLFGADVVLKAPGIRRDLDTWLALVESRPKPVQLGHPYGFRILQIEVRGEQAMAQVHCPLLGQVYHDYLGLLFEEGRWLIVSKMYANGVF